MKRGVMTATVATALIMALASRTLADNTTAEATYGSWTVFLANDPMTDRSWYGAIARSDTGEQLQVDCESYDPDKLNVMFRLKEYVRGGHDLMYRVDTKLAHHIVGSYGDHTASLLCEGTCTGDGKAPRPEIRFVSEVRGGTNLIMRVQDYNYENTDHAFKIDGAAYAFDHLLAGCARLAGNKKIPASPLPSMKQESDALERTLEKLKSLQRKTQPH